MSTSKEKKTRHSREVDRSPMTEVEKKIAEEVVAYYRKKEEDAKKASTATKE